MEKAYKQHAAQNIGNFEDQILACLLGVSFAGSCFTGVVGVCFVGVASTGVALAGVVCIVSTQAGCPS